MESMQMTANKIKEIIDMLNTLNEYLLSLPDDMLLNIDPRDKANGALHQAAIPLWCKNIR